MRRSPYGYLHMQTYDSRRRTSGALQRQMTTPWLGKEKDRAAALIWLLLQYTSVIKDKKGYTCCFVPVHSYNVPVRSYDERSN